jgi:hypothetical protein
MKKLGQRLLTKLMMEKNTELLFALVLLLVELE